MKDFRSVVNNYLNKHDRRRKQLAAVISLSMLISFTVPMILTEPAVSQTKDSFSPVGDILSNQLFNVTEYDVNNLNGGVDGNNGYSKGTLTQGELLIGRNSELYADSAEQVIANAKNKYFLGIASDFCVFLEGNFKPKAADTEGRVAVGGNIITSDDYQIGAGDFGNKKLLDQTANYLGISNFAHIIMGGTTLQGASPYGTKDSGSTMIAAKGTEEEKAQNAFKRFVVPSNFDLSDTKHKADSGTIKYDNNCQHWGTAGNGAKLDEKSQFYNTDDIINFSKEFGYMRSQSQKLSKIKGIEITADDIAGDTVTFDAGVGCTDEVVYFTIDSTLLGNFDGKTFQFKNIPEFDGTVTSEVENNKKYKDIETKQEVSVATSFPKIANIVINVKGTNIQIGNGTNKLVKTYVNGTEISNLGWHTGGCEYWSNNHPYSENILYNCYEASNVYVSANFNGTILAPNADATSAGSCEGHLSGSLIAKSFEGGLEFGYRPYRGTVDILGASNGYIVPFDKFIAGTDKKRLEGATFGIYEVEGETETEVGSFTSDKDKTEYVTLKSKIGFEADSKNKDGGITTVYRIREKSAPTGFIKDGTTVYTVTITEKIKEGIFTDENGNAVTPGGSGILTGRPSKVEATVTITSNNGYTAEPFNILLNDIWGYDAGSGSDAIIRREITIGDENNPTDVFYLDMEKGKVKSVSRKDDAKKSSETGAVVQTDNVKHSVEIAIPVTSYVTVFETEENGNGEIVTKLNEDGSPVPETEIQTIYDNAPTYTLGSMAWNHLGLGVSNVKIKEMTVFYLEDGNGTVKTYTGFENGESVNNSEGKPSYWGNIGIPGDMKKDNIVGIEFKFEKTDGNGDGNGKLVMQGEWNESENKNNPFFPDINGILEFNELPEDGIFEIGYIPAEVTEGGEDGNRTFVTTTATNEVVVTATDPDATSSTISYYTTTSVSYYDKYDTIFADVNNAHTYSKNTQTTAVADYYYDPNAMMMMPLPSTAPAFENDYGLIFTKHGRSNGEDLGAISNNDIANANIEIHTGDGVNCYVVKDKDDVLGGKSTNTINLDGLKRDGSIVYHFHEITAPDGYEKADPIYFTITGTTVKYGGSATNLDKELNLANNKNAEKPSIQMDDIKISGAKITLEKWNETFTTQLSGAKFKLYANNGDSVYPTGEESFTIDETFNLYNELKTHSGNANSEYVKDGYLKPGLYYLEEVEAPTPKYERQEFAFRVKNDYSIEAVDLGTPSYFTVFNGNEAGQYNDKNSYENVSAIEVIATFSSGYDETISFNGDKPIKIQGGTNWISGITGWSNLLTNTTLGNRTVTSLGNNQYSIKYEFKNTQSLNGSLDGNIQYQHDESMVPTLNEIRIYGEVAENSSGSGSGGSSSSTDTGVYTVDCLYFTESWGENAIEEMTVYYANGDTSTLNQKVALNDDEANFVRITSGDGISLNHTSRDNIVGMKIKMSSTNGFKLAIENGDWSSTLWGYDGSKWLAGNRTLEIGDISGKNREEDGNNNNEGENNTSEKTAVLLTANMKMQGVDILAGEYPADVTVSDNKKEIKIYSKALNRIKSENDIFIKFDVDKQDWNYGRIGGSWQGTDWKSISLEGLDAHQEYSLKTLKEKLGATSDLTYLEFAVWGGSGFSNIEFLNMNESGGSSQTTSTTTATPTPATTTTATPIPAPTETIELKSVKNSSNPDNIIYIAKNGEVLSNSNQIDNVTKIEVKINTQPDGWQIWGPNMGLNDGAFPDNSFSNNNGNWTYTYEGSEQSINKFELQNWNRQLGNLVSVTFTTNDGKAYVYNHPNYVPQTATTTQTTPPAETTQTTTVSTEALMTVSVATTANNVSVIKIPNKERQGDKVEISVEKKWAEVVERFPELKPASIVVNLERYLNDGTTKDDGFTPPDAITLNPANGWKGSWPNLISEYDDDNGETKYYKYKVVEDTSSLGSNYKEPTYSPNSPTVSGNFKITNDITTIDITAEKEWHDSNGQLITDNSLLPEEIQVKLQYRKSGTDPWTDAKEKVTDGDVSKLQTYVITLKASEDASKNWKADIKKLPECYEYRLVEVNVPNGWTTDNRDTASKDDKNAKIINTQKVGSLEISKIWKNDSGTDRPEKGITVELYRSTNPPVSGSEAIVNVKTNNQYENYAKLLQYSLYFYDANMCGSQVSETSAYNWRDDCHNGAAVDGGFHDAGDHTMFGLPQGFTASTLGWSYYEFKDAYDSLGQTEHYKTIMKYFCDFFEKCIKEEDGTTKVLVQKGAPGIDQSTWDKPEGKTAADYGGETWVSSGAANIAAEYAASLASYAVNFPNDSESAGYLNAAKKLYEYAEKYATQSGYNYNNAGDDECKSEMAWAAAWLYLAARTDNYKTNCQSYLTNLSIPTSGYFYGNVAAGAMCLYGAHIDRNYDLSTLKTYLSGNCTGENYKVIDSWASARHNTLLQTVALSASKNFDDIDYKDWCKNQMAYLLGKNKATVINESQRKYNVGMAIVQPDETDTSICFITGFAENSAKYPHHRAASGYTSDDTRNNKILYDTDGHTIIGALVGGPNSSGDYTDSYDNGQSSYEQNEIALDYNVGLVGAAAGLYYSYHTGELEDLNTSKEKYGLRKVYDETPIGVKTYTEAETITLTRGNKDDSKDSGMLSIGDERKLVLKDSNGETVTSVTWSVENPTVAAVTEKGGILKAVEDGTATIQAKIGGDVVAEYALNVSIKSIVPDVPDNKVKVKEIGITAGTNNDWKYLEQNLPLYDANGKKYYYYIKEKGVNGYYAINYTNNGTDLVAGETKNVSVTNKKYDNEGVTMPSAGGTGTRNYYVIGLCLIGIAGTFLAVRRRKTAE